jgi:hypothetical protein
MNISEKFYDQAVDKTGMVCVVAGVITSVTGGVFVKDAFEDAAPDSVSSSHVRYEAVNQMQKILDAQLAAQKKRDSNRSGQWRPRGQSESGNKYHHHSAAAD